MWDISETVTSFQLVPAILSQNTTQALHNFKDKCSVFLVQSCFIEKKQTKASSSIPQQNSGFLFCNFTAMCKKRGGRQHKAQEPWSILITSKHELQCLNATRPTYFWRCFLFKKKNLQKKTPNPTHKCWFFKSPAESISNFQLAWCSG